MGLPDDETLAEKGLGGLVHGLVREGSGTRDDSDTAALVDEAGHDTNFALTGRLHAEVLVVNMKRGADARVWYNNSGAVGADETMRRAVSGLVDGVAGGCVATGSCPGS